MQGEGLFFTPRHVVGLKLANLGQNSQIFTQTVVTFKTCIRPWHLNTKHAQQKMISMRNFDFFVI